MKSLIVLAIVGLLATNMAAQSLRAVPELGFDGELSSQVDRAVNRAIETGKIPGAVVFIGRNGTIAYSKSYGLRSVGPEKELMSADTIFDLASLTKPIATAASIMLLVERGKMKLDDTLGKLLPDFDNGGKSAITVEQLLRHRTGLVADNPMSDYKDGPETAWKRIAALKTLAPPGERFVYSDVNYLILGRIVEKISGETLDRFSERELFEPLGMKNTRFRRINDPATLTRVAPTEPYNGVMLRGIVHDPRARALENVAGHAGLFGTADDLGLFATMLLDGGKATDGRVIFKSETVAAMISPGNTVAPQARGLGWDIATPYTTPKGRIFGPRSVGHTGFTGTSLWLDPDTKTYVILLTSRLHPDGKRASPSALRSDLATIVGEWMSIERNGGK